MTDFLQDWWPPDQDRLKGYELREQLFEGDHQQAFRNKGAKLPKHLRKKVYLEFDYPKLISTTYADLLFGEAPVLTLQGTGEQDALNQLVKENDLFNSLYEAELSCSFRGDSVFRVGLAKGDDGIPYVAIEEKPAYTYFVELDPDNRRRTLSQCLAWERPIQRGGDVYRYLRVERHKPGIIENELYLIEGHTKIKRRVDLSVLYPTNTPRPIEETGVDFPLLFHFPNTRHGSRYWGQSDYTPGLINLFDEVNFRWTNVSSILDKHADPKMAVPFGMIKKDGSVKHSELNMMEVGPDDKDPRYLGYEPRLDSCFEEIETLEEKILMLADISPAMFGKDKAGNIESGRAMRQRFIRMLTRVLRKASYRQPRLQKMLFAAMMLAHVWLKRAKPSGLCEVLWRNGLPSDDTELTDVAARQVEARIMSRFSAIRYARRVGPEEAQAEMDRIAAEQAAAAPQESSGPPQGPEVVRETPAEGPPEEV